MIHFTFYLELIAQYTIMFPNNKHIFGQAQSHDADIILKLISKR